MPIRILVVDDNLDILRTYTKTLPRKIKTKGEEKIVVDSADTVSLAIKKLNNENFEILVIDLRIPGLSGKEWGGLEILEESIKLDQLRPIIVITGYGNVELVKKTLTQGVFDFIEKSSTAVEELIQAVQRAIDSRYEKILRSGNPFTPMSGIQPIIFGGRTKELEFFEQKLYRAINSNYCEHFLVLGDWGIGKSTLLREYKKLCQSRGYITSVVTLESLQPGTTTIEAARSLVEGILRDFPYPMDRFKKVVNFFDSVGISIFGTGLQLKRNTLNQEISVQAFLHDALTRLWQDIQDETKVLVILIDELENFMAVPEIIMTLRSTLLMDSFKNTKILLGLASTTESWLSFTKVEKHHPLSRYFVSQVKLEPLKQEEVSATVRQLLAGSGVSFEHEIVQRIVEYTEGHPFQMQLLGSHLFDNQLLGKVNNEVWDKALQDTLNKLGSVVFERLLDGVTSEEGKVLNYITHSDTAVSDRDIQSFILQDNLTTFPASAEKYIQSLLEKRLLRRKGLGLYTISDAMLRAYIRSYFNG